MAAPSTVTSAATDTPSTAGPRADRIDALVRTCQG